MKRENVEFIISMVEAVFLFALGVFFFTMLAYEQQKERDQILEIISSLPGKPEFIKPTTINWQVEKEFVTVLPVEKIGELEIGQVIINPINDTVFFPVLVIPFREIPIGTKVEIIELENLSDIPFRRSLIMIKPIKRKSFP